MEVNDRVNAYVSGEFRAEGENSVFCNLEDGELENSPVEGRIPVEEISVDMISIGVKREREELEECMFEKTVLYNGKGGLEKHIESEGVEASLEEGQISQDMEADMDLSDSSQNNDLTKSASLEFGFPNEHQTVYGSTSTNKKQKLTSEAIQQPSVHVEFTSLTSASKRKLEELLLEWSEWHVRRDSLDQVHTELSEDNKEVLESGECTYYPALRVGRGKHSTVSFWFEKVENQSKNNMNNHAGNAVPYYDREYALGLTLDDGIRNVEGGLEIIEDPSRCFNCGSYSHSLKDCDKPRDNLAVDIARKEHKLKKNQNHSARGFGRYYQSASSGKFDDLRPGTLHSETRKALGIEELDPPPWLNRMRELGYPPGYMDEDVDESPSDITIFGDEEVETKMECLKQPKLKMSVEFQGINAAIPDNANTQAWAPANRLSHRLTHPPHSDNRWRHHDDRWSADYDDGPPGVDPPRRAPPTGYGGTYDLRQRLDATSGRTHPERDRRSYLDYEDPPEWQRRRREDPADYNSSRRNNYYSKR